MRCHLADSDDEMNSSPKTNWTSRSSTSNILNNLFIPKRAASSTRDFYNFDVAVPSLKRKLLEYGQDDLEELFYKSQRKKQLQKIAAQASLVVENDDDSDSEEDRIYQQMDWIEKQCSLAFSYISSSDDESDDAIFDEKDDISSLFLERCKLLNISMAKMNNVEDPEAFLWRSVLINNTVRRLQGDTTNYRCHSFSSYAQENIDKLDSISSNNIHVFSQKTATDESTLGRQHEPSKEISTVTHSLDLNVTAKPLNYPKTPVSLNIEKIIDPIQYQNLQDSSEFYDKGSLDEQNLKDTSVTLLIKQQSPLNTFSFKSCGLQFQNSSNLEGNEDKYEESNSSILDSVVCQSLMASIET